MEKLIIYMNDDGILSVVCPSPEAVSLYGIKFIAEKDVPFGKPYKIIDVSELPEDRTFRDAWEVDPALLDDGVGAYYGSGSNWSVISIENGKVRIQNIDTLESKTEDLPL